VKISYKHENGFYHNGRIFCEVYCIKETETDEELLNLGWLPSMDEFEIWYQSRSCRLNLDNHNISSKRRNILNKLDLTFKDYNRNYLVDNFFKNFYNDKKFDIIEQYENCSDFFKIKLIEVKFMENIVGYARITERKDSNIFLNLSYSNKFSKLSLGTNLFFILSEYTKKQNKKYLYIYESYNDIFNYKEKFKNVEIWNGREWIINNE